MSILPINPIKILSQTRLKNVLTLMLGVVASLCVLITWHQLSVNEQFHVEQLIQQEANAIASQLSKELSIRILTLQQMANRWQVNGGTAKALWEADAAAYIQDFHGYQAIEWVDPAFKIQWIVPQAGNETAKNLDLSQEQRRRLTLRIARDLHQIILTRRITLVQGGKGFLATVPLFVDAPGGSRFDGFILGVFRFQTLFDSILRVPSGYNILIYDGTELIYRQGHPDPTSFHKTVVVRSYGADWQIDVFPTPQLIAEVRSSLPIVILIGGLVLVGLFVLVVHFAQVSYCQIHQFKKANRQLQWEIQQRQQAEATMAQLAAIVEFSEDAIISQNLEGIILIWNAGAERIFGYTASEIVGQSMSRLIPLEYQDQENEILQKIKREERIEHDETKYQKKDGTLIDISISIAPIKDETGTVIAASKIARNITERKQAEVALQNSEARYRQLINNLNAGFVIHAPDTRIRLCNATACELLGLSMDQMLGKTAIDPEWHFVREDGSVMSPEEYPVNQVLSTQIPLKNYILGIHSATSPLVWVLVNAYPEFNTKGLLEQVVVTFINISEHKQAEEKIQQTRNFLQTVLDHLPVAVFVKDARPEHFGVLQFWNKTSEQLFGISAKQAIGKTGYDFFPIEQANFFDQKDREVVKKGDIEDIPEEIIENPILGKRWLHTVKLPIYDLSHQPQYLLCFCEDITERKQAEAHLKEMSEVMENAVSGISKIDTQGRYLYVNKAYSDLTGYEPEEMIGMVWEKTVHPDELENMVAAYWQMVQEGRVEVETTGIRKEGSVFYKQLVMIATYDEQHQLQGHYCFMKDISDRKHAELALEQQLLRSQTLINTSVDGIVIMDHQGKVVEASPSFARMIGYPLEETLKLSVYDWDAQWTKEELQLMMKVDKIIPQFETRHRRKDGSFYDVEISRNRVVLDGEIMNFCICRDISDRKQAEQALRYQKEMFQTIVDRIPIMIALFNDEGKIELINPEIERVLGWSLEDWQQKNIFAECYPDPVYRQSVLEYMLKASGKWQDLITTTATGQQLETSWANVRLSSGHYLGIGQDISERQQKELALRQAMEAAEAANLAKSIFLANMSHELRTPLNVILGFTQVMAHDPSLTPTQQEDLQTIQRSGDHLLSLINDVLDLSKIESGHCTLEESDFDLIALLHSLRTMLGERASSKGLDLCLQIAPEVPQYIRADAQKLRQVLLNLLGNAIKFTHQGSVTLNVISRTTAPLRHLLQFAVSDTGVGIAPEEQDTIFDAFVQAQAGKRSVSGTGLGLTISRKLLQLMGGEISVSSILGQGSTFTFTLPVRSTSGINLTPEQSDRLVIGLASDQPHHRILVVDDRLENRLLMVRLLTQLGLEVQEATNGQEAVQIWKDWQPNLTWMDIRMPLLDGYEATKQIRAMEGGDNTIIIALTAQASQSDRTLALAAGCNDYISKPFRQQTLFVKMAEYLGLEYVYQQEETGRAEVRGQRSEVTEEGRGMSILNNQALTVSASGGLSVDLKPLATLPQPWLRQLEEAAVCGDDGAIAELVEQLPPELSQLGIHLTQLANEYQFEQILNLLTADC